MNHWTLAFVGDYAQQNCGTTQKAGVFFISSDRTPVRRAQPNDRALLYLAGQGFVAEAEISSPARAPDNSPARARLLNLVLWSRRSRSPS